MDCFSPGRVLVGPHRESEGTNYLIDQISELLGGDFELDFSISDVLSANELTALREEKAGFLPFVARIPEGAEEAMNVHRPALMALYNDYFESQNIDAMVFPTTILPAGPIEGTMETIEHNGKQVPTFPTYVRNAEPASIAGLPGITLPIGLTGDGLPLAMELDAASGNDEHLLAIALAVEPLFGKLPAPEIK